MEEKKLTDEEIVKAFVNCTNKIDCEDCPLLKQGCITTALDLIHRLQDEIERLTEKFDEKVLREIIAQNCVLNEENAELQKQVEKMKADITKAVEDYKKEMPKAMEEVEKLFEEKLQQAVKDTAKEILGELENIKQYAKDFYGLNEKVGVDIAINTMKTVLQRKGVEVE